MSDTLDFHVLHKLFSILSKAYHCSDLSDKLQDEVFLSSGYALVGLHAFLGCSTGELRLGWNESGIGFELRSACPFAQFHRLCLFFDLKDDKESVKLSPDCCVLSFTHPQSEVRILDLLVLHSSCSKANLDRSAAILYLDKKSQKNKYSIRGWLDASLFGSHELHSLSSIGFSFSFSWGPDSSKSVEFSDGAAGMSWVPGAWASMKMMYVQAP